MSAHVLVSGTLFRAPEEHAGKTSGKHFVAATVKVRDGEAAQYWRVLAFSGTAQAELRRLADGDALSVQGGLRAEAYSKDCELRVGLTVIADAVLPLRCARKRQPREPSRRSGKRRRPMTMRFRFNGAGTRTQVGVLLSPPNPARRAQLPSREASPQKFTRGWTSKEP